MHSFTPRGVCSRRITFDLSDDGIVSNVRFEGGCNGNTQGIARLAEGMKAQELIARLKGVRCGMRPSSCPDQFALAIEKALESRGS